MFLGSFHARREKIRLSCHALDHDLSTTPHPPPESSIFTTGIITSLSCPVNAQTHQSLQVERTRRRTAQESASRSLFLG